MSRIGNKPITVPAGVEVKVEGNTVTVKGPKGTLTQSFNAAMEIKVEGTEILVTRPSESKEHKSLHGLTRTLVNNMVIGVSEGFKKELEINGIGYRAAKTGKDVNLNLGFSHPVVVSDNEDIVIEVPAPNKLIITGILRLKIYNYIQFFIFKLRTIYFILSIPSITLLKAAYCPSKCSAVPSIIKN